MFKNMQGAFLVSEQMQTILNNRAIISVFKTFLKAFAIKSTAQAKD